MDEPAGNQSPTPSVLADPLNQPGPKPAGQVTARLTEPLGPVGTEQLCRRASRATWK
ncbi:protein of unknown function [Methylorubrum extorquens]|uniref:Uncharacterized protein n=1 Tax=Methylorubrum extorquens TaxID=408 RepID=A0A2N9AYT2_METEX|nr:protein of unknown function [Methylorubrum extorquens]